VSHPQVDHRVISGLEGVVQFTDTVKAKQLRGNPPPRLAFRHIECQSDGILHSSLVSEPILARCAFERKFSSEKTCNQLIAIKQKAPRAKDPARRLRRRRASLGNDYRGASDIAWLIAL